MIPLPKRLGGGSKMQASQRRSKVQEASTAQRLGGKVTKQSGGGIFEKGDVRVKGIVRVESKTTKHKSFSVTREIVDKIEMQALASGELPVIDVEIDNAGDPVGLYVVPRWALEMLVQRVASEEGQGHGDTGRADAHTGHGTAPERSAVRDRDPWSIP